MLMSKNVNNDVSKDSPIIIVIDHFTVECLVAWPSNESAADVDLDLTETSWLFLC